jgi:hypothetical protein
MVDAIYSIEPLCVHFELHAPAILLAGKKPPYPFLEVLEKPAGDKTTGSSCLLQ